MRYAPLVAGFEPRPCPYAGVLDLFDSSAVDDSRLGLTGPQTMRVPLFYQAVYARYGTDFAAVAALPQPQFAERFDQLLDETRAETLRLAAETLRFDAAQTERLLQLDRRAQGPRAFLDGDVLDALALTDEQRREVTALALAGGRAAHEALDANGEDPAEAARQLAAAQEATLADLGSLLTAEQEGAWQRLIGEPPRPPGPRTLVGHSWQVYSVEFSSDGKFVASGSFDRSVRLWNVATGREERAFLGHTKRIRTVTFSPDGGVLASGAWDNTVRLWDLETGAVRATLVGCALPNQVVFSPDGTIVAAASTCPDGRMSLRGPTASTIVLWDAATGRELRTLRGHTFYVYTVAFSPDGALLASGSRDETARVWDAATGEELAILEGGTGWVLSVAFSPDGKTLATSTRDGTINLWDVATFEKVGVLAGHTDWVYAVAFRPDGALLASGSKDATIKLWDVVSGELLRTLAGHESCARSVDFSPDGTLLASGSWDHTVKLWDVSRDR